jgi:IS605 OrfB family transposase
VVVRAISKVADAYKLDRQRRRAFRPLGAIAYDSRILRWYASEVSIWTVVGRERIPFVCGERERALLPNQQGESDLVYRDGRYYLYTTINVEEPPAGEPGDVLGADFGIVNILADSDGTTYSGAHLNSLRHRNRRLRQKLQAKGTKSAKRLLRQRRHKERRFGQQVNHSISKRIVSLAQGTGRAIAIEELGGIRDRVTARRQQRATLHGWSFRDLRAKIEYKARLVGVRVVAVDPRNTSRTCVACGHCAKGNRPHRDTFLCQSCGLAAPADYIAALNIRGRGRVAVNQPNAGENAGGVGTPASPRR